MSRPTNPLKSDKGGSRPRQARPAWLTRIASGLLAATIIARLLTPTDAAMMGETIWIAELSLVAFAVWGLASWRFGRPKMKFDWLDAAALMCCGGHVIGALVVIAGEGNKRSAMTMLWEWIALFATYWMFRRESSRSQRGLVLAVCTTAIVLAGYGVWQHHFGYETMRREYESFKSKWEAIESETEFDDAAARENHDRRLAEIYAGLVRLGIPADVGARILFEHRLYSTEPIGLFALANTLAGVLVVAAILFITHAFRHRHEISRFVLATAFVCGLGLIYCLLLTKSRTAWVGFAFGLAVQAMQLGLQKNYRQASRTLAVGAAAIALLVGVAYATGGLDRLVVSESTKSLRYRFEYWTSTWRMLRASPHNTLVGVGPGNFRQNYLEFKLPQSSEEIADPHNLFLDVWANGGLLALVGLIGIATIVIRSGWQGSSEDKPLDSKNESDEDSMIDFCLSGPAAGAVLGFAVTMKFGIGESDVLLMMLLADCLLLVACRAIFEGPISKYVASAGTTALLVHLLGAGGIGMPAVSQFVFILAALALPAKSGSRTRTDDTPEPKSEIEQPRRALLTVCCGFVLCAAGYWLAVHPIVAVQNYSDDAKFALTDRGNLSRAERNYQAAATIDLWDPGPCERLGELYLQKWRGQTKKSDRDETYLQAVEWQKKAIARDQRNPGLHQVLGEIHLEKSRRDADSEAAARGAAEFELANRRYPNDVQVLAYWAESLWKANMRQEAIGVAQRGLELDRINEKAGHVDKRLSAERLELLRKIVETDSN